MTINNNNKFDFHYQNEIECVAMESQGKEEIFFSIIGRTLQLLNLQNLLIFDQLVLMKYTVKTEPLNLILN